MVASRGGPDAFIDGLMDTVRQALLVLDQDLRVLAVNQSFVLHFGIEAPQAIGRSVFELEDGQWEIPELRRLLLELLPAQPAIRGFGIEHRFPARGERVLLVNAGRLAVPDGSGSRVVLALEDITERQRAERVLQGERDALLLEVRHHEDQLACAQAALNAETIAHNLTREQLQHANRLSTVGKLTAAVAHEIGTPINVITARGQLILRGHSQGEQAHEDVEIMVEQAERVAQRIRELLDFSRQRRAHHPVNDLRLLAESTLRILISFARHKGVRLAVEPGAEALAVEADADHVQQVLSNLVVNALDALEGGGGGAVVVDIRARRAAIGPGAPEQDVAVLTVTDDGPGIAEAVLGNVFDPFFTTKEPGRGTGLGLAVSRRLVEQHGGRISVDSDSTRGTCFTVLLPRRTVR